MNQTDIKEQTNVLSQCYKDFCDLCCAKTTKINFTRKRACLLKTKKLCDSERRELLLARKKFVCVRKPRTTKNTPLKTEPLVPVENDPVKRVKKGRKPKKGK